MLCKVICIVLAHFIVTSQSNRLDPNVFRGLGEMDLPNVGNGFQMEFFFNTYDNVLVNAHSDNATYSVHVLPEGNSPSVINLFIPMEEVNLRGVFQSDFEITTRFPGQGRRQQRTFVLVNHGRYYATMAKVNLAFAVHVARVRSKVSLYLHHCHPIMEEIAVELVPEDGDSRKEKLEPEFLRGMMNMVSKEEYADMFCKAMERVLITSKESNETSAIVTAIMNRIKQRQFPKSA